MIRPPQLLALDMGIDTHDEPVVYMRRDCDICRAEGFTANTRLYVTHQNRHLVATLNVVDERVLPERHMGFSRIAWQQLALMPGANITVRHTRINRSMSLVRKKIYGNPLSHQDMAVIIKDIVNHVYSDIEIAGFLTACAGDRLSVAEIDGLTRAMVSCGKRLQWPAHPRVFDKHCVGGLPGNRTTPIVIAICSAAGLVIPKTSSRAITSPAGTADTMEVLTRINLSLEEIQHTVHTTNACLAWGGEINLSPADELLIRIERALDLDSEGQLVASVLSKKIAAGSTDILIDIPLGPTAKVRDAQQAERISSLFTAVATQLGVNLRCIISDGSETIGYGIGPAEEARDVLAVLRNHPLAPIDLREKSLMLSAELLVLAEACSLQKAQQKARQILASGTAWEQFQRICITQGGLKKIPTARYRRTMLAQHEGTVVSMDNRRLARLAKLAGAPFSPVAGLRLHIKSGHSINKGDPLFTLFSASPGELTYASNYFNDNRDLVVIGDPE